MYHCKLCVVGIGYSPGEVRYRAPCSAYLLIVVQTYNANIYNNLHWFENFYLVCCLCLLGLLQEVDVVGDEGEDGGRH